MIDSIITLLLLWCAPTIALTTETSLDIEEQLYRRIDSWDDKHLHDITIAIEEALSSVETEYRKTHPELFIELQESKISSGNKHEPTPFWRKIFNCMKCEMDDGTTGISQAQKKEGKEFEESLDVGKLTEGADMKIGRVYALEWVLFPPDSHSLAPNAMMAFICEPKPEIYEIFGKKKAEIVKFDDNENILEETTISENDGGNKVNKVDDEKKGLMSKIYDAIQKAIGKFVNTALDTFKDIWKLMLVTVRCGVCVVCNLINIIVDIFKYIRQKAEDLGSWVKQKGNSLLSNINKAHDNFLGHRRSWVKEAEEKQNRIEEGKKHWEQGNLELGGYCEKNEHCKSKHCKKRMLSPNECVGSETMKETREHICNEIKIRKHKCILHGCQWKDDESYFTKLKCIAYPPEEASHVNTLDTSLLDIGDDSTTWESATDQQRLHRIIYNMHQHDLLNANHHEHDQFVRKSIEGPKAFKSMMKSAVSMLQVHSSEKLQMKGIIKLPNACVSAANIGTTITLAINYENPDLVKVLFTYPWDFTKALPELLVAISPMNVKGEGIAKECLMTRSEGVSSADEMEKEAVVSMKKDIDEDVNHFQKHNVAAE
jgi:hypothetical protein